MQGAAEEAIASTKSRLALRGDDRLFLPGRRRLFGLGLDMGRPGGPGSDLVGLGIRFGILAWILRVLGLI